MPLQRPQSIVQAEGLSMFHMLSDNGLMSQPGGPLQPRSHHQVLFNGSQSRANAHTHTHLLLVARSTRTAEINSDGSRHTHSDTHKNINTLSFKDR